MCLCWHAKHWPCIACSGDGLGARAAPSSRAIWSSGWVENATLARIMSVRLGHGHCSRCCQPRRVRAGCLPCPCPHCCQVILFNKWLLAYSGFPFPIALTMWHMAFCSMVGVLAVRVLGLVKSHRMPPQEYFRRVMPIGAEAAVSHLRVEGNDLRAGYATLPQIATCASHIWWHIVGARSLRVVNCAKNIAALVRRPLPNRR